MGKNHASQYANFGSLLDTEQVLYEDFVTFDKAHLPEMLPVASYTRAAFSGQSFARPVWTGSRLSH